jgi:ZIP family zinc transporter
LHSGETIEHCHNLRHQWHGPITVSILAVHSFIDGLAVGLVLQVSASAGLIMATAVLAHNFSDGLNIVGLLLKNGHERQGTLKWLIPLSFAPALGIFSTNFFNLSENYLGLILALFGGFFLYIGASELLPESHHGHSTRWTTMATVLGMGVLYLAIKLAESF